MTATIVTETVVTETVMTEIWVSRDFDIYTHRIWRNGGLSSAKNITATRAAEIINSNPGGRVRGSNPVTFAPGAKQFTWIAKEAGDGS